MVNNIIRKNTKFLKEYPNKSNRVDKLIKNVKKVMSERFKLIEELQRREKRIRREFDRAVSQKKKKNINRLAKDGKRTTAAIVHFLELQDESLGELKDLQIYKNHIDKMMYEPIENFFSKYLRNSNSNGNGNGNRR